MEYEISIKGAKAKSLITFLKQLDFVELKAIGLKKNIIKPKQKIVENKVPFFNTLPDWDIDAKTLRQQSNKRKSTI